VYAGDGYSIPYEVATTAGLISLGLSMQALKLYLDSRYPEYARLHDWLYTPYGGLIQTTQDEADRALREELTADEPIIGEVVYQACATFGYLYFGVSQTGYAGGTNPVPPNMPLGPTSGSLETTAMATKIVILFQQTTTPTVNSPALNYSAVARTAGWSESLFGPDSTSQVVQMLKGPRPAPVTGGLLPARAACLSNSASIVGVRLYSGGSGKGQLLQVSYNGSAGDSDVPNMGVLMNAFDGGSGRSRRWLVRGVPDHIIVKGEFAPDNSFVQRLGNYTVALQGFSWQYATYTGVTQVMTIDITGLAETATPHGFPLATVVTLKNVLISATGKRVSFTGRITQAPTPTSFLLPTWPHTAGTRGTVGLAGVATATIDATTTISAVRAAERHVGRPFVQYRGRKSNAPVA
jgi:hypothetical protein